MRTNIRWIAGFLVLFGIHCVFLAMHQGRLDAGIPPFAVTLGAAVSLIATLALIIVDFMRRDEVERRMALVGGSAAALGASLYSFGVDQLSASPSGELPPVWSVSIMIFLLVYGGLQWQARS